MSQTLNEIIYRGDNYYISFIEERSEFAKQMDDLCHELGGPAPKGGSETALCIKDNSDILGVRYLILYGDHREEYKKIASNLQACIDYFNANLDKIGCSSDLPETTDRELEK